MSKILACIDGSIYSASVADHAAWAAVLMDASVELMQVLGRRDSASQDRSGRIVAGARRQLLEQLAEMDGERSKLLAQAGAMALNEAKERLHEAGVRDVTTTMRQGDLLETLAEREEDVDFVVVGKRGEAADFASLHLGSNLERILRSASVPILVSARQFTAVNRIMLAFDGRPASIKAVTHVATSPLFKACEIVLTTAGDVSGRLGKDLDSATKSLSDSGRKVTVVSAEGAAIELISKTVIDHEIDLLVMGAYGHSRLRTLVIGSTTSEMIRQCKVPILVYR